MISKRILWPRQPSAFPERRRRASPLGLLLPTFCRPMVKRLQVWLNRGQPNLPSPSLQAAVAVVIDRRRRGEHQLGASIENLRSLSPLTTGRACLMSTKSSSIQCPRCYTQVPEASFQYCPNCGSAVSAKTPSRLWLVARIVPPLVTLWGSFLAWVRVAALAPNHNRWNVYHFGHGGLAWLAGDVVCLLIVVASLARVKRVVDGMESVWRPLAWPSPLHDRLSPHGGCHCGLSQCPKSISARFRRIRRWPRLAPMDRAWLCSNRLAQLA